MAYFVEIYCRLAIRLCIGYHVNGRERYRTVNIWNVRRDATAEQVAMFVRALELLLDGRVVRVRLIRKDRLVTPVGAQPLRPFPQTQGIPDNARISGDIAERTYRFSPKEYNTNPESATSRCSLQRQQGVKQSLRAPPFRHCVVRFLAHVI